MKRLRGRTLIVTLYVLFSCEKILKAEVLMRVRPGDDVTIYCDCEIPHGSNIVWVRNCSHQHQPSLVLNVKEMFQDLSSELSGRFSFVWNATRTSFDLKITHVTENDLGLYFCARVEKKISTDEKGIIISEDIYNYGKRTTRLSLIEESFSHCVTKSPNITISTGPEWHVGWKMLVGVSAGCVFLSSLVSSICVYCICVRSHKGNADEAVKTTAENQRSSEVGEREICYAMLDVESLDKRKIPRHSDCSFYSEVTMERTDTLSRISE